MKSNNAGKGEVRETSGICEQRRACGREMNSAVFGVRGKQVSEVPGSAGCSHDVSTVNFLIG